MAVSTAESSRVNKAAGLAIMAAVVFMAAASAFFPGIALIDQTNQSDYQASLNAISGNTNLAQLMTSVGVTGMLLYAFGFFVLYRATGSESGLAATSLRFGIGTSLFAWGLFAAALGMRHMVVHLLQRSAEEVSAAEQLGQLAMTTHVAMAALLLAFLAIYPFGTILVGFGLAARFRKMDLQKLASVGLAVMGAAALLNYLVVQHIPTLDLQTILLINNMFLGFGSLCLFVIGFGIFRGRRELTRQ